ncbi:MAG: MBL fold metallo-hydrolase [Blautia sp.]|nr:MBL fold metallo-hydrolase [Blautia sp.]
MRFCSIASGSSGNCVYAGSERTHILIDAGIAGKRIEAGLRELDLDGSDLDAILVTHEHSDHIKSIGMMARKYHVPVYMTGGTADVLMRNGVLGRMPEGLITEIREDEPFEIGDLTVCPFTIPHDAAQPVGYRIGSSRGTVGIATDLGKYTGYIIDNLKGLDALLIEANHDINMLQYGRYPYPLKQRILGDRGHLSNDDAGRMLCELLHDDIKGVLLGHLSKENNFEQLAFETVCGEVTMGDNPYRASDFNIQVASREHMSEVIEF